MVDLVLSGKPQRQVIKEYDLSPSSLSKWIEQYGHSGLFKERESLTDEQRELKASRKRIVELEMENDTLKQAALIMGRKSKS